MQKFIYVKKVGFKVCTSLSFPPSSQVDNQESIIELWRKFLNPLTWPEVLRQVLVAAGFGSSQGPSQRETADKVLLSFECACKLVVALCSFSFSLFWGDLFK